MSELSLVFKNAIALNVGSILANLFSVCTTLLIARQYGERLFGQYTFALSFAGLFLVVMELGVDQVLIRDVTRHKAATASYFAHAVILRIICAGAALLVMIGVGWQLPTVTGIMAHAVILAGLYMALQSLANVMIACFRAYERMEWVAVMGIVLKALTLGGVIVAIAWGGGIRSLLLSSVLAAGLVLVMGIGLLRRLGIRLASSWEWSRGAYLVRESLPIAAAFVCASLNAQLDVVLLRQFWDDATVGFYGAALTVVTALLFVSANFASAMYPRFAQLAVTSRAQLAQYYERSLVYLAVLAFPMAAVLTSWADPLVRALYGEAFRQAVPALRVLGWALAFQSMNAVFYVLLLAMNRQRLALAVTVVGTGLGVGLDLLCIPRWGILAAAGVRVAVFFGYFIAFYVVSASLLYRASLFQTMVKPAVAAALLGLSAWLMRDLAWWVSIPVLGVVYLGFVSWLKVFGWQGVWLGLGQWLGRHS